MDRNFLLVIFFLKKKYFISISVCMHTHVYVMHVCGHACHGTCMEVKGKFYGVYSLLCGDPLRLSTSLTLVYLYPLTHPAGLKPHFIYCVFND